MNQSKISVSTGSITKKYQVKTKSFFARQVLSSAIHKKTLFSDGNTVTSCCTISYLSRAKSKNLFYPTKTKQEYIQSKAKIHSNLIHNSFIFIVIRNTVGFLTGNPKHTCDSVTWPFY